MKIQVYKKIFNIEESSQSSEKKEQKYRDERTGLISGQFQQEKYPDTYEEDHLGYYDKLNEEAQLNLEEEF